MGNEYKCFRRRYQQSNPGEVCSELGAELPLPKSSEEVEDLADVMTAVGIDYNWVALRGQFQDGVWRDTKTQEEITFYPPAEEYFYNVEEGQLLNLYRPFSSPLKWQNQRPEMIPDTICQKSPSGQTTVFIVISALENGFNLRTKV